MENTKKKIPGFQRYLMDEKGEITNRLTDVVMKPELHGSRLRVKLVNDQGIRIAVFPSEIVETLFKKEEPVVEEDPFSKDTAKGFVPETKKSKIRVTTKFDFASMPVEEKKKIHSAGKITEKDVIDIRRDYDNKVLSKKQIAAKYGICWQTAGKICNRKIYKNVPEAATT